MSEPRIVYVTASQWHAMLNNRDDLYLRVEYGHASEARALAGELGCNGLVWDEYDGRTGRCSGGHRTNTTERYVKAEPLIGPEAMRPRLMVEEQLAVVEWPPRPEPLVDAPQGKVDALAIFLIVSSAALATALVVRVALWLW